MLPKKHRLNLRKRTDFFKKAERYYSPLFTLHYQADPKWSKPIIKATVVVKKKNLKTAAKRNQLARKAREALRTVIEKEEKLALVLVLKKQANQTSVKELEVELKKFIRWLFK